MKLFGLKNCDTCRKALKSLPQAEFIDVRAERLPKELLARALAHFGDALVNTRSTTWRGLSDSERQQPAIDLMVSHPTLMKRPLIIDGDQMFLGWTATTRQALGVE